MAKSECFDETNDVVCVIAVQIPMKRCAHFPHSWRLALLRRSHLGERALRNPASSASGQSVEESTGLVSACSQIVDVDAVCFVDSAIQFTLRRPLKREQRVALGDHFLDNGYPTDDASPLEEFLDFLHLS